MVKFSAYFKGIATLFADLLDVKWERKRGIKHDSQIFDLQKQKELSLIEVEKPVGGKDWRAYTNSSVLFILNLTYLVEISNRELKKNSKLRYKLKSYQYICDI